MPARHALLALAALICSGAASAQMALPTTPLFAIEAVPFLSRFAAAVKAAGLEAKLSDPAFEGTIFVPVDLVGRQEPDHQLAGAPRDYWLSCANTHAPAHANPCLPPIPAACRRLSLSPRR
jgi:membrane-bound lytic murein transglycosylase B